MLHYYEHTNLYHGAHKVDVVLNTYAELEIHWLFRNTILKTVYHNVIFQNAGRCTKQIKLYNQTYTQSLFCNIAL